MLYFGTEARQVPESINFNSILFVIQKSNFAEIQMLIWSLTSKPKRYRQQGKASRDYMGKTPVKISDAKVMFMIMPTIQSKGVQEMNMFGGK